MEYCPGKLLPCITNIKHANQTQGVFITPEIQGEIWAYLYSQTAVDAGAMMRRLGRQGFPRRNFHPLGIDYHPSSDIVFSTNVGTDGPGIEIFKLAPTRDSLMWERTFQHPSIHSPNSIAAINDHELLVTNDHYFKAKTSKALARLETYLALPLGSVVYVNLETNKVKTLAHLAFANGIKLLNSTHVAVASTTGAAVKIYRIDPDTRGLTPVQWLRTPFLTDNLSVDSNGKLLVTGHPFAPDLERVASINHQFNLDGKNESLRPASERPRAPTWVSEWDGNENGTLKDIFVGYEFGSGTTAVRDCKRKIGIVTGLYEKGVLVWKE